MTLSPGCACRLARAPESFKLPTVAGGHISLDPQTHLQLRLVPVPNSLRIGLAFLDDFIGPFGNMVKQQELLLDKMDVGTIFLPRVKNPQ